MELTFEEWWKENGNVPLSLMETEQPVVTEYLRAAFEAGKKSKKNDVENAIKVLIDNGNLYFEDYEGKVSPITYCSIDKLGDIVFKE